MTLTQLSKRFRNFRDDCSGTITLEAVITLPLLVWMLAATFEFFEVHRFKSAREKATYTIADMISREQDVVTATYMDNTKTLFDEIANDDGLNQLRVSIVWYDESDDQYNVSWSEVRGTGILTALTDGDVSDAHDDYPLMTDGEEVIVVESVSNYDPHFDVGLSDGINIETRVFTSIRFAPQICFNVCTSS